MTFGGRARYHCILTDGIQTEKWDYIGSGCDGDNYGDDDWVSEENHAKETENAASGRSETCVPLGIELEKELDR
ncbi:unnamed protein product [Enterobius vermicularis]|uniref:Uncharacterized protein n=1 Tax=Enterobius vermicularis TaxID=51028 RepID=A0A0N4VBY3_ENTVE|nr:unnamed protein product [Enterobius vermicularis]